MELLCKFGGCKRCWPMFGLRIDTDLVRGWMFSLFIVQFLKIFYINTSFIVRDILGNTNITNVYPVCLECFATFFEIRNKQNVCWHNFKSNFRTEHVLQGSLFENLQFMSHFRFFLNSILVYFNILSNPALRRHLHLTLTLWHIDTTFTALIVIQIDIVYYSYPLTFSLYVKKHTCTTCMNDNEINKYFYCTYIFFAFV